MPAILVTGRPGTGKTTLVRGVVEALEVPASGFYTRESRGRDGRRTGFELVTLEGRTAVLANVGIKGRQRVGRYGVDVAALDRVGVPAVEAGTEAGHLIVIDEIGKMELLSIAFQRAVVEALRRERLVFGTIMLARHPFADEMKARRDTLLFELSEANRKEVRRSVEERLRSELPRLCR